MRMVSLSHCHHLEHRAERTENVASSVRPESVAKAVRLWPAKIRGIISGVYR